jgi:hypothetical protein
MSVCVRECLLEGSLVVAAHHKGLPPDPARRSTAAIERNYFLGTGTDHHLLVTGLTGQSLANLVIRHNVFAGKTQHDILLDRLDAPEALELSNNTLTSTIGIAISHSVPQGAVTIRNNLRSREGFGVLLYGAETAFPQASRGWTMDHNAYPDLLAGALEVDVLPRPPGDLAVLPRFLTKVPQEADYLRVAADDPAATAGAGGEWASYIGALPPGPAPKEGDWFTRLRERWQTPENSEPMAPK